MKPNYQKATSWLFAKRGGLGTWENTASGQSGYKARRSSIRDQQRQTQPMIWGITKRDGVELRTACDRFVTIKATLSTHRHSPDNILSDQRTLLQITSESISCPSTSSVHSFSWELKVPSSWKKTELNDCISGSITLYISFALRNWYRRTVSSKNTDPLIKRCCSAKRCGFSFHGPDLMTSTVLGFLWLPVAPCFAL